MRAEPWLPLIIGAAWWASMYPGLFGEDSLMTLSEARDGPVSVWFTAWWIYAIRGLTVGMRAIPLLTLFGVLTLTFATRRWAAACFPPGVARALAVCLICATPLVGALGIQVRHDVEMTAGLLLCAAVVTRLSDPGAALRAVDVAELVCAALLVATRHNGSPTVLGAAAAMAIIPGFARARQIVALVAVGVAAFAVTRAATQASGHRSSIDPMQSVEWAITDMSCLLSKDGVTVTDEEWMALTKVADRSDWPQRAACRFMDKELFNARSFRRAAVGDHASALMGAWWRLFVDNPAKMTLAHIERVRLFLPPIAPGLARTGNLPFIHSTILPNDFGLAWTFPRVAETVRLAARAWNAMAVVVANAGIWLIGLFVVRRSAKTGRALGPTIAIACALEIGILATAPMSEGRYGLFILICGQTAVLLSALGALLPRTT